MKYLIIPPAILSLVLFASLIPIPGTDVIIDPDPTKLLQNEISLTLLPGDVQGKPNLLLAAYNDHPYTGGPGLGVSTSTDGGATWTASQLPYPFNPMTGQFMTEAFDPTVASDTAGNVYAAHISTDQFLFSGLYVHKSANNGVTWLPPVTVALDSPPVGSPDPNFRFNDRCQMTVDKFPTSPYPNYIYIAWIKDRGWSMPQPFSDIYVSFSTDQGVTFSPAMRINDVGVNHDLGNMPVPAVAPNGTVYVSWLDYNVWTGGTGTIYLDKSTNGGMTWGPDQFVTQVNLPPLYVNTASGVQDALAKGAPVLGVSPNNSNELYLVYAADPDGMGSDEADIHFIKSVDGGMTWTPPIQINDEVTLNDQILPWMAIKPDGTIDIAWYDRRNDPADAKWDVFIARSIDGGVSFSANVPLNDQPFTTPTDPWGASRWMGEYLALAVEQGYAYVVFTTSVTHSLGDVYFDKIPNSQLPILPLWTDMHKIPLGTGGIVNFVLDAGPANAGRNYFLLGSVTGTFPGFILPGGLVLPLNWDIFTTIVFKLANTPALMNFQSVLDASGKSTAQLNTFGPLPPTALGVIMDFAYLLYWPFNYVSNPVGVVIVP